MNPEAKYEYWRERPDIEQFRKCWKSDTSGLWNGQME
jgi:hypothetical protein